MKIIYISKKKKCSNKIISLKQKKEIGRTTKKGKKKRERKRKRRQKTEHINRKKNFKRNRKREKNGNPAREKEKE